MMKSDYDQLKEMFSQKKQRDLKSPLVACPPTLRAYIQEPLKKHIFQPSGRRRWRGNILMKLKER